MPARDLNSIASQADSLSPFHAGLHTLNKAPAASRNKTSILQSLVLRVVDLEPRLKVQVVSGPKTMIRADAAQIEQALINLVHNAVDAALETQGNAAIGWRDQENCVEIFVQDEGQGIMNPANLFVPFFTTKPEGSGIGLPLSRQIAEAHDGSLVLINRENGNGATALLRLPR